MNNLAANLQVVQPEGRDFRMLTDPAHAPFYLRNNNEAYSADLVLQHCRDGGTFIDIGAHHGFFTLLVASQHRHCRVMAFEPAPDSYQILRMNIRLMNARNVRSFNSAVSDRNETRDFQLRDFSSHGSLYPDHISATVRTVKVKTVSLDRMLKRTPRAPLVVKIDTEGHELGVLRGMANLLTRAREATVLVEFNPIILRKANQQPKELLQLIASLGFDANFVDDERRQILRFGEDRLDDWESRFAEWNFEKGYSNILCLKNT